MPPLLTFVEAAKELGPSVRSKPLRAAAARHGFVVQMGRTPMIDADELPELIKLCRENPKAHVSTPNAMASGTSAIKAVSSGQQALATAEKLIGLSRRTSCQRTGPPAPVVPIK